MRPFSGLMAFETWFWQGAGDLIRCNWSWFTPGPSMRRLRSSQPPPTDATAGRRRRPRQPRPLSRAT
ncbi:hypothetical protein X962_5767 [Burkholderia pseudomallei MSHR7343]|nr:hypothetical protein X962_5767 [Burkholderia pseudomallei MSHR7343]